MAAESERAFPPGKCFLVTQSEIFGAMDRAFRSISAVRVAMPDAYSMTFWATL